jgi:hypothetical protein
MLDGRGTAHDELDSKRDQPLLVACRNVLRDPVINPKSWIFLSARGECERGRAEHTDNATDLPAKFVDPN